MPSGESGFPARGSKRPDPFPRATLSLPSRRWMFALGCAWEAGGGGLTVPDLHVLCNCKNVAGCKALHTREPRRQCQPGGPNHPLSVTISGSRPVGLFLARSDCSHTKLPFSPSSSRYRHGILCQYPHDPSIVGILSDGAGPMPSCQSHAKGLPGVENICECQICHSLTLLALCGWTPMRR